MSALYANEFLDYAATRLPALRHDPFAKIERATSRVPAARFCEQVARAIRATSDPDLGFRFGASAGGRAFGLLGIAMAAAPTLGQALLDLSRWQALVSTLGRVKVSRTGGHLRLAWAAAADVPPAIVASTLCGWLCLGRRLAAEPVPVVALQMSCARCRRNSAAAAIAGCEVRFGARDNAVVFPTSIADIRSRFGDATVHSAISRRLDDNLALLASGADPQRQLLLDAIRAGLASGSVCQDLVASRAGLARRTLQRQLAAQGIGYRRALDAMRAELALTCLGGSDEALVALAHRVGFSEQATFSRAVRRWSGRSPREIRSRFNREFWSRRG